MTLALRNPGEVTAKDIKLPQGFEIVNKDLYICTVSTSVKIDVDLYATIGHGFRSFTVNAKNIDSLSLIAVDSNFSPIVNFSYKVEEEKNDLNSISDSLILDITTNGSVTPVDALVMASKIMTSHFEELSNVSDKIQEIRVFEQKEEIKKQKHLVTTIDDLNLSFRSVNSLKKAAIYTLSDLTNLTRNDLNNVNNLGKKSIKEITNKLKELKLQLKHESES
jgi:DNA-directed RNA polymerase subunit alpha